MTEANGAQGSARAPPRAWIAPLITSFHCDAFCGTTTENSEAQLILVQQITKSPAGQSEAVGVDQEASERLRRQRQARERATRRRGRTSIARPTPQSVTNALSALSPKS